MTKSCAFSLPRVLRRRHHRDERSGRLETLVRSVPRNEVIKRAATGCPLRGASRRKALDSRRHQLDATYIAPAPGDHSTLTLTIAGSRALPIRSSIRAVPRPLAVTTPFASTVATASLLLDQTMSPN